jgi:hypothetical protein
VSTPDDLNRAIGYLRQGKPEQARPLLVRFLQTHPRSDVGWYLLSFAIPEHARQLESLNRALAINPDNARARARLGELTSGTGQPKPPRQPAATQPPPSPPAQSGSAGPSAPAPRRTSGVAGPQGAGVRSSRRLGRSWPAWVKPAVITMSVILVLAAIGGAVAFFQFFISTVSGRDLAQATGLAASATTRATLGAAVGLPPTWTLTPSEAPTELPTITATPSVTPTATPAPPDRETLDEMATIQVQVSDLRGLAISGEPSSYLISVVKVRPFLESSFLAGGGSKSEVDDLARTLVALGLTKPTYDLYTNILNSLTDSIGGFYLPWSKEIFVIGGRFSGIERWVYSHEYDHALVDQHYHIDQAGVYPLCQRNQDQCKAIEALVEGDATLLMTQWLSQYANYQDYNDILNYHPPAHTLPEDVPPPYAGEDAGFPYIQGLAFVQDLYKRGNWAEVDRAYQGLPASTEQILHVDKFIKHEPPIEVPPQDVAGVLGPGWRKITQDTLGEWTTYLLLGYSADQAAQVDSTVAAQASQGWGGDIYQVFYDDATNQSVLVADWMWDTTADAGEFRSAMGDLLAARYRGNKLEADRGACWAVGDEVSCLVSGGREVVWILGPHDLVLGGLEGLYPGLG